MFSTAVGIAAWALITGVTMGKSGLPVEVMVLMSLLVFAGSAQLAVLPLMSAGAPVWVVWATALCVNLRFVVFSALWRPYVVHRPWHERARLAYFTADLNYVLFMRRFPEPRPAPEQWPYFWGGALALLGIALSLLEDRATADAGTVAACAAVAAYSLPLRRNIVVAIAAAVAIGALMDHGRARLSTKALDDAT